jgi:hypothetical protein
MKPDDALNRTDDDVRAFLNAWRAPAPDPAAQARLIRQLGRIPIPLRPPPRLTARWTWLIARSQFRLVHPALWIASALVMALGGAVTMILYKPTLNGADLPFALIAPLVAAVGAAFLYGGDSDPPLELQLSTPISNQVILLARLALLFSFNLVLGMIGSVALAFAHAEISLAPLILAWLAPMSALSALAFLLSVLSFDPRLSVLISMTIWGSQVMRRGEQHMLDLRGIPDLLREDLYPLMFGAALAAVLLALWLAAREQHWSNSS